MLDVLLHIVNIMLGPDTELTNINGRVKPHKSITLLMTVLYMAEKYQALDCRVLRSLVQSDEH